MIKSILTAPHPKLKRKSKTAVPGDQTLPQLIQDLKDTLLASQTPGVGLSAPQIGANQRVFIADLTSLENQPSASQSFRPSNVLVFLNPKIIWASDETNTEAIPDENLYLEGCLSVPHIYALIKRPYKIKLEWQTAAANHKPRSATASWQHLSSNFAGFAATIIQHEIDHLNGILFTDHAIKQSAALYEDKKGELVEVKI